MAYRPSLMIVVAISLFFTLASGQSTVANGVKVTSVTIRGTVRPCVLTPSQSMPYLSCNGGRTSVGNAIPLYPFDYVIAFDRVGGNPITSPQCAVFRRLPINNPFCGAFPQQSGLIRAEIVRIDNADTNGASVELYTAGSFRPVGP